MVRSFPKLNADLAKTTRRKKEDFCKVGMPLDQSVTFFFIVIPMSSAASLVFSRTFSMFFFLFSSVPLSAVSLIIIAGIKLRAQFFFSLVFNRFHWDRRRSDFLHRWGGFAVVCSVNRWKSRFSARLKYGRKHDC